MEIHLVETAVLNLEDARQIPADRYVIIRVRNQETVAQERRL